jgi:hypothetical protein
MEQRFTRATSFFSSGGFKKTEATVPEEEPAPSLVSGQIFGQVGEAQAAYNTPERPAASLRLDGLQKLL